MISGKIMLILILLCSVNGQVQVTLYLENRYCVSYKRLADTSTPLQCAVIALVDSWCGNQIFHSYSSAYCHCCAPGSSYTSHPSYDVLLILTPAPTPSPTAPPTAPPTASPTPSPTASPTPSPTGKSQTKLYSIQSINNNNASCNNLVENVGLLYDVSLDDCRAWCDSIIDIDCKLFNYFEHFKTINDSRCYIFNELCNVIFDGSTYNSYIGYFDFETECVNYPFDWNDKVGDSCSYYKSHNWCNNSEMLKPENNFGNFADAVYQLTAMDTCCECTGGINIMANVAFSIDDYWNNFETDILCTWMDNNLTLNRTSLHDWDNLILFDICQDLNTTQFLFDPCVALIDTQFTRNGYWLHLCEYNENDEQNRFQFIMDLTFNIYSAQHHFYVNMLWFNLDLSYYSPNLIITHANYSDCAANIIYANDSYRMGVHPCYVVTDVTTNTTIEPTHQSTPTPRAQSDLYSLQYIENASCIDLHQNLNLRYDISLSNCTKWCEDTYHCQIFNYMENVKQINESRCYIFSNSLCSIKFSDTNGSAKILSINTIMKNIIIWKYINIRNDDG